MTNTESVARPPDRALGVPVLLGVTGAFFAPTLWSFGDTWATPTYTHGYVVALAALWLAWRADRGLPTSSAEVAGAQPVLIALSIVWLCATVTNVQAIAQGALPLILLGWSTVAFGRAALHKLAPVAAFALLAVPLWEVLLPPLQAATTLVSGGLVRALGVPAEITGNFVEIESGSFLIEDGCAGLNYLLAGLTIGALYAQLFAPTRRGGLLVIALAAALAIAGNWVRVASIIVIGHLTQMQSPLVEAHLTFGWAIFLVGLFAFFPLARWIERRDRARLPAIPPTSDTDGATTADVASGVHPRAVDASLRPVAVATLLAVTGPAVYYTAAVLPTREPTAVAYVASAGWRPAAAASLAEPSPWRPAFTGASDHVAELWTDGASRVSTDRLVYRDQAQGAELIGYGNRIAADSALVAERLIGPVGSDRRLVNEAIVREGDGYLLVWYWYRVGGHETESAARAKLLELWAFATLSRVSELVALSTPCEGDSCVEASRTLNRFLGAT